MGGDFGTAHHLPSLSSTDIRLLISRIRAEGMHMRSNCMGFSFRWMDSRLAGNGIVHAQHHDMCLSLFIPALELVIPARDINGTTGRITLLFIVFFSPHIRRAAATISIRHKAIFKHNIIIEPPGGQVEVSFQILSFHVITLIFPNPQSLLSSILFDDVLIFGACQRANGTGCAPHFHAAANRGTATHAQTGEA